MAREVIAIAVPRPSAELTAAEELPPAMELQEEAMQPDQPFDFDLPQDASGLAVSRRRPVAPAAHTATAASSSSTARLPPTSVVTAARSSSTSSAVTSSAQQPPTPVVTAACSSTTSSAPSSAVTASASSSGAVPKSTFYARKKKMAEAQQAREAGAFFVKEPQKKKQFNCTKCGLPKTKENGHTVFNREHYCSRSGSLSVEEWRAEKQRAAEEAKRANP